MMDTAHKASTYSRRRWDSFIVFGVSSLLNLKGKKESMKGAALIIDENAIYLKHTMRRFIAKKKNVVRLTGFVSSNYCCRYPATVCSWNLATWIPQRSSQSEL